jgi:hypothetical protein
MTSTPTSRSGEYRRYAEECWEFTDKAEDIETKAAFELVALAWSMLAAQAEKLEGAQGSEAIIIPSPPLQSAA